MSAAAPLVIDGLVVRYGARTAVDGLSLRIERGEIFGLLGPNGAGKTSTMSVIEGLLPPSGGTVLVDGEEVTRAPLAAKSKLGVQLQSSSFQAELTIAQLARLYAGLYGLRLRADEVRDRLAGMGLDGERGQPFKRLSGGQQQRFSLLVATLPRPMLMLLDEPTQGLDPQSRRQLWSEIEALRGDGGAVLLTTHSMEEAQAVCDRIAIIDHGRLLATGSPAEVVAAHREDPAVQRLAHGEPTLEDVFIALTGSAVRD